jgi:uncharacterized protein
LKIVIAVLLAAYIVIRLIFVAKKRGIRAMLISIAILLVGCYVGVGLILFFMQPKLLYYPMRDIPATPAEAGLDYENVFLATSDNIKLNGWYVPAQNAELTVLFCHGNGGNIGYYLDTLNILHLMNVNCLIFDYRGYGLSEGRPSEEGTYADALAAYKWLTIQKVIEPGRIVIFGRSLGGSIAAQLAGKVETGGLILESTFTSCGDIGSRYYPYFPVRWLCRYRYNTMEHLSRVKCPVLIIHSTEDELVPFEMGQRLYDAAKEPRQLVKISGTHNEGFIDSGRDYVIPLDEWLDGLKNKQ